ncbi:lanthionine synthetase LanC family protein [Spirosoma sp. SC4-14]|uniref:lanthionine synthetase LanC family protein n=1 Tax=Spirosoma sp. SC4-14 TaxID=3128900 RepID=UPI0030D4C113
METLLASSISRMASASVPETNFVETAAEIGRTLCRDAIWQGSRCNFLSSTNDPAFEYPKPYFKSLEADFYSGTAGVAFFLSALYRATGNRLVKKTAIGALQTALATATLIPERSALGFFAGWTGIVYATFQAAKWLNSEELMMQGQGLLDKVMLPDLQQTGIDVIDGAAGAIPALARLEQQHTQPGLRAMIVKLADLLLDKAVWSAEGVSWPTVEGADHPNLTGFAHGVAGIVNALLEAFTLTKDIRYRDMAFQGLRYENAFFDQEQQNWPDFRMKSQQVTYSLRQEEKAPGCSCAWCHGAPGIALSRLRGYELTQHPALLNEAITAVRTTATQLTWEQQMNFSLCHGLAGNAEILLEAADILNASDWHTQAEAVGRLGQERYQQTGLWTNGLYNTYQIPDFMLGLSGIGYFYLRLSDPATYRSVLLLR